MKKTDEKTIQENLMSNRGKLKEQFIKDYMQALDKLNASDDGFSWNRVINIDGIPYALVLYGNVDDKGIVALPPDMLGTALIDLTNGELIARGHTLRNTLADFFDHGDYGYVPEVGAVYESIEDWADQFKLPDYMKDDEEN